VVAQVPGGQPAPGGQPGVPAAPQPAPQVDAATLAHLQGWEKAMAGVKTFAVKAEMTLKDKVTDRNEKFTGHIWCMAPNLTRLRLEKQLPPQAKRNGEEFTAFICDGKMVYHYDGPMRMLTVAKLGPNGSGNNLLLDVMSGMTAVNAVARFDIRTLKPNDPKDQYIYLELRPKWKEDKAEFEAMQLILIPPIAGAAGREYLPRFVKVFKPGGQKLEEWDFPDPKVNPDGIAAQHFQWEKPPEGWKVQSLDTPQAPPPATAGRGPVAAPPPAKR
jgi:TIGR03009 family protein